jgi:hypothetical protein
VVRVGYLVAGMGKGDVMSFALSRAAAAIAASAFFYSLRFCAVGLAAAVAAGLLSSSASAEPPEWAKWAKRENALGAEMKKAAADCDAPRYNSARQGFIESKMSHGYTESEAEQAVFKFYPYPQCSALPSPVGLVPGAQPFVGFNIGGGFQGTNFSVDPQFNVNGSGVTGGGFGGVLLPVPNTNVQIGPRFGVQGSNITGSIASPAASPLFTYTVRTDWMAYQEAIVRIPVGGAFKIAENESPLPQDRAYFSYNYYDKVPHVTGSVGVAESGTSVKGVSGMFSVTDNAVRTGITFTAGFDVPVAILPNGNSIDLFTQYRGIQWIGTVNIPGAVNIGSFTNEVDVGVTLHLGGGLTYTLKN